MCLMTPVLSFTEITWTPENVKDNIFLHISFASLLRTTQDNDGFDYIVLLVYNGDDVMLGKPELRTVFMNIVKEMVGARTNVHVLLKPIFGTKCGVTVLWNALGAWGFDIGCDYFVPNNDDLVLISEGWAKVAMDILLARTTPCPNFGIVAFKDRDYPDFPTFHVVSRLHLYIHNKVYYPIPLTGWGNDPWIYESYKRVGAAEFGNMIVHNHAEGYDKETGKVTANIMNNGHKYRYDGNREAVDKHFLRSIDEEEVFLVSFLEKGVCCPPRGCVAEETGAAAHLSAVLEYSMMNA